MSNRRLDISSLLCNDDDVPHRSRPTSMSSPHPPISPPPSTPSKPFLGLEALVHVATEERRRLSGGSDSVPSRHHSPVEDPVQHSYYQSSRQAQRESPQQMYAQVPRSPASPYLHRSREQAQSFQPLPEHRSPAPTYTRTDDEPQRYQPLQRQRQLQEHVIQQDQYAHNQRLSNVVYSDSSPLTFPPPRPTPSMPLQVEDTEQLRLRTSSVIGRSSSDSFTHKYPSSPMQPEESTPLLVSRSSLRELLTPAIHDSPVPASLSTSRLCESVTPVTPTMHVYQSSIFHPSPTSYRRGSPANSARDFQSPSRHEASVTSPSLHSRSTAIIGEGPPSKRRRSDSPSRLSTTMQDVNQAGHETSDKPVESDSEAEHGSQHTTVLPTVPPPISAAAGPTISQRRPGSAAGKKFHLASDSQSRDRGSYKVMTAFSRRSPPGSAAGRAKAAKKADDNERNAHGIIKKEYAQQPTIDLRDKDSIAIQAETSESNELASAKTPPPRDRLQTTSKIEPQDAHEWLIEQYAKSPTHPPHSTPPQNSSAASTMPDSSVPGPSCGTNPAPADLESQEAGKILGSFPMHEEVVPTLEQELEELLAEPDEAQGNRMDVDTDRAVTQLVAEALGDGEGEEEEEEEEEEESVHPKQHLSVTEADVDVELLRLVDDQRVPSPTTLSVQPRQALENQTSPPLSTSNEEPARVLAEDKIASGMEEILLKMSPNASAAISDGGSMPPPTLLTPNLNIKGKLKGKDNEENSLGRKTNKSSSGSKKKEVSSKASRSKASASSNTNTKPKAKSTTKSKARPSEATATASLPLPKPNKVPIPPPMKRSASSTAASRSRSTSVMPGGSVGPEADSKVTERQEEEESSDAANDDDKLYCVCKTKYDEDRFMIACDRCDEWYHTQCVDMSDLEVDLVDQFICPICVQRSPQLSLRTTYKQRCLNGLRHPNPDSLSACHKPALGGGVLSKFCSQDCGIKYMEDRIDMWVKKGGKRERLWESVKDAEKREGVVIRVDDVESRMTGPAIKTEDIKPLMTKEGPMQEIEVTPTTKRARGKGTKSQLEVERLESLLQSIVKMREEIKKGMEVVTWRERLLELASERARQLGQCGWDQRLCFGDEEWAEFGTGVLESYEVKEETNNEMEGDMQIDSAGTGEGEGEWWCPGKTLCDRHAGWQNVRSKDVCKEKVQKEEALVKLTTRERELRKRIEDIVDPHGRDIKSTPHKSSAKLPNAAFTNGHVQDKCNGDPIQKGKKRKSFVPR
ncbi:hypothetical protein AX17_000867 [Amanita inopinata Kibby_2008]|nr:hypothetical protein AX17_000867 [Amanita inopinata Kibby_2008]